jgi:hypothetical protein
MKSSKGIFLGLAVILGSAILIFGYRSGVAGQDGRVKSAGVTAEAGSVTGDSGLVRLSAPAVAKPSSAVLSRFGGAAGRNSALQAELSWVFGGKSQRGWQLYIPLIASMIDTDGDGSTGEFALKLYEWQKSKGIEPSGVLDDYTWSKMIATWQGNRMKGRIYPSPDQLVTIPPSECFDPSRAEQMRKVERETYAAYKRMIAAAAADASLGLRVDQSGGLASDEKFMKIISAHRSREHQERLRAQSPNSGRAGLAVNSPHFTGRALDIYVGGEPVSTKDDNRRIQTQTKVYRWLAKNAHRFGFRPYFYEPWHWEYVGVK